MVVLSVFKEGIRIVLKECYRVLAPGGKLFYEEIDGRLVRVIDRVLVMHHPKEAAFTLKELEAHIEACGFEITATRYLRFIGIFGAEKRWFVGAFVGISVTFAEQVDIQCETGGSERVLKTFRLDTRGEPLIESV